MFLFRAIFLGIFLLSLIPSPAAPPEATPPVDVAPAPSPVPSPAAPQEATPPVNVAPAPSPVPSPAAPPEATPPVKVGPAPSWVVPIDSDSVTVPATSQVEDGVDYILIDRQQNLDPAANFSHYTTRLINERGVQSGSDIRGGYDPSYQTFTLHWLKVKRDGVWQDRLPTEKLQVLQREENLDSQMLDGRLSVVCHLQDVRIGDVIDYAFTVTGANPVFNGKFMTSISTSWANPVHLFSSQVIVPPNRKIFSKGFAGAGEPVRSTNEDQSERLLWKATEVPATFWESNTPDWYDTYGWVQLSEYASWKEVADWGLATFPFDAPLSPDLEKKVADIAATQTTPEDKALAVFNFVQNDIRYLGIEMGANSYRPTPPSLVCEHRFGDCKDKTLLAVVMLRALGIEAYPALVNTQYRQDTGKLLPSPLAFDHAIVQLSLDNRTYWIDPTRTGQRGRLRNFYISDYRQALLVKAGTEALVPITVSPESMPFEKIDETFKVTSVTDPVIFKVHSTFTGRAAESLRSSFGGSSREKIEKAYLDYYAAHYATIKVSQPLRFQDFPADNRFEIWEEYAISHYWNQKTPESPWKGSFNPYSVADALGYLPSPQRVAPYDLNYPRDIQENLSIEMFEKWSVDSKPNDVDTPYFTFSDHPSVDDKTVHFDYHYKSLVGEISPANMTDYHDQLKKIKDTLTYTLTYHAKTETPAPEPAPPKFQMNWIVIALAAMFATASLYLAYRVYAIPRLMPPLPLPLEFAHLQGLSGWLALVILGLLFRTGLYLKSLVMDYTVAWDATQWNNLTVPGSSSYDPLWAPTLLFELGFTIFFLVLTVLALVVLFQRRATFPKVMIAFFSLILVFKIIDVVLVSQIPYMVKLQGGGLDSDFFRVIVQSAVWIPYFFVSKRVKATFRF